MLHLVEGFDLWTEELGKADLILVCGSYGFKKQRLNLSRGYGREAVQRFESFSDDMWNWFKYCRTPHKKMPTSLYGVALPEKTKYVGDTRIGMYQTRADDGRDLDVELLKWSINMVKSFADQYYRIALEYPCKATHGADEEAIYPILSRLPEHCVFYRCEPPRSEVDYAGIGRSYNNAIKYGRPSNPQDFHRR